eukprot:12853410-Prorocentrum_lima.AAC.1
MEMEMEEVETETEMEMEMDGWMWGVWCLGCGVVGWLAGGLVWWVAGLAWQVGQPTRGQNPPTPSPRHVA